MELNFPPEYNDHPPFLFFLTVPFHPNIDIHSGRPCVDFLDDLNQWHPDLHVYSILQTIQQLLAEPSLEQSINPEAAHIYQHSPHLFHQIARDTVVASKRFALGARLFDQPSRPSTPNQPTPEPPKRTKPVVSYDDYYQKWKETATSLPMYKFNSFKVLENANMNGHVSNSLVNHDDHKDASNSFMARNRLAVHQVKELLVK